VCQSTQPRGLEAENRTSESCKLRTEIRLFRVYLAPIEPRFFPFHTQSVSFDEEFSEDELGRFSLEADSVWKVFRAT
jgi:hypothetical protein